MPLVKVPLQPKAGRDESGVTVSVPGLVVAGVLVLTTFLVIPLLFSTKTYKDFRSGKRMRPIATVAWGRNLHSFLRPSCRRREYYRGLAEGRTASVPGEPGLPNREEPANRERRNRQEDHQQCDHVSA